MLSIFLLLTLGGGGLMLFGFIRTQGVEGDYWRQRSKERIVSEMRDPAQRGDIYSADGKTLATTIVVCDLYLDLGHRQVRDRDGKPLYNTKGEPRIDTSISEKYFVAGLDSICMIIHEGAPSKSVKAIKEKLLAERAVEKPKQCMLIARNFPYTKWLELRQVTGWRRGIVEQVDDKDVRHHMRIRIYDNLGGNVVGMSYGLEERYTGLEGYYDSILRGQDGVFECRRLTRGTWLPERVVTQKIDGGNITSTIDTRYQDIAEQALRDALTQRNASQGCVVLMETATGYVKACSNLALDSTGHFRELADKNIACSDRRQPGSTFKTVVLAAIMNSDSIKMDTSILLRARVKRFDNTPQGELTDEHAIGDTITVADAIIHSSNVAMADLGWKYYRKERNALSHEVRKVFPGQILNIDLRTPESKQRINNLRYTRDFLNFCFGYGTAVSPMQLLTFYNAIANNGRMVKPLFCQSYEVDGKTTEINVPVVLEQGMSRETAQYLQRTLRRVVTEGTATSIKNTSYGIAGKTGTAKINATGYSANDAYFVGFFPIDRPKYTCLVMINNTMSSGGAAAAPVMKRVADGVMALDKELGNIMMETLSWETPEESRTPFTSKGFRSDIADYYNRLDIPFALADSNYRWVTYNEGYHNYSPRTDIMPNCKGMTAKDAIRLLNELGMKVKFSGYGRVSAQQPKPHTPIKRNTTAILTLSN